MGAFMTYLKIEKSPINLMEELPFYNEIEEERNYILDRIRRKEYYDIQQSKSLDDLMRQLLS